MLLGDVRSIPSRSAPDRFRWEAATLRLSRSATGAETNYFGHPEWAQYAPGLKDVDEAVEIQDACFSPSKTQNAIPIPRSEVVS